MDLQTLKDQICTSFNRIPEECNNYSISWEIITLFSVVGLWFIIIVIMYFVHFAKVVNRKASIVPFENAQHFNENGTSDEQGDSRDNAKKE